MSFNVAEKLVELAENEILIYISKGVLKVSDPEGRLTEPERLELKNNKELILRLFATWGVTSSDKIGFLSYQQRRLWLIDKIEAGSTQYNMPATLKFDGKLDPNVMRRALSAILDRHPTLRTVYKSDDRGVAIQVIREGVELALPVVDLSHLAGAEQVREVSRLTAAEAALPFDLASDLMLRATLLRLSAESWVLLFTMHHIAADGWSQGVLSRELSALYAAVLQGRENPLPPLPIQYIDYAHWQRHWMQGEVLARQLEYWTHHLRGLPTVHNLPLDHARPAVPTYRGGAITRFLGPELRRDLNAFSQSHGVTPFMVLHAAFVSLLSRYSGEHDIVVGSPIAGREQAELASMVGLFVNTLVLRSDLSGDPVFADLLIQSKERLLAAYEHQQIPFEKLVDELKPERSLSHNPLFQVMLVLENNEQALMNLPGLTLRSGEATRNAPKFDLILNVMQDLNKDNLRLDWEYAADLFDASTIERMAGHFEVMLKGAIENPKTKVSKLPLLTAAEQNTLLVEWNNTHAEYPQDKTVHELFEEQVEKRPDAIALVYEDLQLSYGELNRQANRLAHYLIEQGVRPDAPVGICLERSPEMVISILGILKAGGCYMPLEPTYPEQRLRYILENSAVERVLTHSGLQPVPGILGSRGICLDRLELADQSSENPGIRLEPQHAAYAIYTSGSTGQPKGVVNHHRGLMNRLAWMQRQLRMTAADKVLQKTPFTFDVSVWEFLWPLREGAQLVLARPEGHKDPEYLAEVIQRYRISILHFVPSMLEAFLSAEVLPPVNSLKQVVCSGEELPRELVRKFKAWSDSIDLYNLYGPTEASIDVSCFVCEGLPEQRIPIGRPIDNTQLFILDAHKAPVPVGVPGELYIGGVGLARGYLNRPDLTAERFIPNPFGDKDDRLYRTGDLVRYLPDGNIEFLGRMDHQVKIRGFRIELGEIEHALLTQPEIKESVVVAHARAGDKYLVAYIVPHPDQNGRAWLEHEALRQALRMKLPEYMVPPYFVELEALPLSPNGKVDRKALLPPDISQLQTKAYVAPNTEMERQLVQIWSEVLNVPAGKIGIEDNFFELGGHSLLVIRMIACLRQRGIALEARQAFITPTLAHLAAMLDGNAAAPSYQAPANLIPAGCERITPEMLPLVTLTAEEIERIVAEVPGGVGNVQDIYPLAPVQEGILFHHMMSEQGDPYVLPFLLRLKNKETLNRFLEALQFVMDRHDVLRTGIMSENVSVPVQVVYRRAELPVAWLELDAGKDVEEQMRVRCAPENQRMDVRRGPLLRLQVAADPQSEKYFVLLQLHHIISDHVALEIIQQEFVAYQAGEADRLPIPVPYREFVAHALHQAEHHDAQAFFRGMLGDVEEPTLPFNLKDVRGDGSRIEEARSIVSAEMAGWIRTLAREMKMSPAVLFHAAWALVVSACSGREDVVFGTVLSGRLQGTLGAEHTLGMFINTLPIRVKLSKSSVAGLISQVQDTLLNLLPYEQASLALAQRCSGVAGGTPLFSALLNYRHSAPAVNIEDNDSGTETGIEPISGQERTNYPFNLSVDDVGNGFELDVQVDASVGAGRIVEYVQTAIEGLVKALRSAPDQAASRISILPEPERRRLLVEWNATALEYPRDKCIHELFEEQARREPEAVAVVFEDQQLTYAQLNSSANRLAHYLREVRGLQPDTLVSVCLERSLDLIVGILGILKAGGAYVPLDPEYPKARVAYMLEDAGLETVITTSGILDSAPITRQQAVCLDDADFQAELNGYSAENPQRCVTGLSADNLAYVIYTSGSTGQPKGVMIEHASLTNFLCSMRAAPGISADDALLAVTSTSFDIHTLELYLPLISGARTVITTAEDTVSPANLSALMTRHGISIMQATPSTWKMLLAEGWEAQRPLKILCGGEAWSISLKDELLRQDNVELWNMYGPTETTVWSSVKKITPQDGDVHLGPAIANTQLYVLDENRELCPVGVPGELYIGGKGLARGYLNRPELTQERFVNNPFSDRPGVKMYRTGDLVRWLAKGDLQFMGRIDQQVKIRGFRIELEEIENQLSKLAGIQSAVVVAREDGSGNKRLVAYIVADAGSDSELVNTLRTSLQTILPDYMVPSAFVPLDALPLTPNGKIDKKALPAPEGLLPAGEYVAPRTDAERTLAGIWSQLLAIDIERLSITANFFVLGGDSILSIQMVSRAAKAGLRLTVNQLFEYPTIRELAQLSTGTLPEPDNARMNATGNVPIIGDMPLTVDQASFLGTGFNLPHWAIILKSYEQTETLDPALLDEAINALLAHHDAMRARFTQEEGVWRLTIDEPRRQNIVSTVDLSHLDSDCVEQQVNDIARDLVKSFDLSTGPLIKIVQIDPGAGRPKRMLFAIHHLICDGLSLQIISEDIATAYQQLLENRPVKLPAKTTSVKDWIARLEEYANSDELKQEAQYWHSLPWSEMPKLPVDFTGGEYKRYVGSHTEIPSGLSERDTLSIMNDLPRHYGVSTFDVITAALVATLSAWLQSDKVLLCVHGSGRHVVPDMSDIDLSRTVGWLSYRRRVFLQKPATDDISSLLNSVSRQLKALPNQGSGFGIMATYNKDDAVRNGLRALPEPQLWLNYTGVDALEKEGPRQFPEIALDKFAWTPPDGGEPRNIRVPFMHPDNQEAWYILLNSGISNNRFYINWRYSENLYRRETIEALADNYLAVLRAMAALSKAS